LITDPPGRAILIPRVNTAIMPDPPSAQDLHAIPELAGFTGPVPDVQAVLSRLAAIEAEHGVSIQLLDAGMVYGEEHLRAAFAAAARATARGRSRGTTFGPELMRYAAGERQISTAIAKMGVGKAGGADERVAAVAWGVDTARAIADARELARADCGGALRALADALGWKRDDGVLKGDASVLAAFGVDAAVAEAKGDEGALGLILEKVALADLKK